MHQIRKVGPCSDLFSNRKIHDDGARSLLDELTGKSDNG